VRVADQHPAVEVLEAERPSAGPGEEVGAGAVVPDAPDAAVRGPGEDGTLVRAVGHDEDVLGPVSRDREHPHPSISA